MKFTGIIKEFVIIVGAAGTGTPTSRRMVVEVVGHGGRRGHVTGSGSGRGHHPALRSLEKSYQRLLRKNICDILKSFCFKLTVDNDKCR